MIPPSEPIDWERLAAELGTIRDTSAVSRTETGSFELARQALERIIGPERFAEAVEHYVSFRPGFELARSVLWSVRPWSAMAHCHAIFDSDSNLNRRRAAVELLRVIADRRAVVWIDEFLADPDPEIQVWGIGVLDQLIFSALVDESACARVLSHAERHANPEIRATALEIRRRLNGAEAAG
jgi:hypothetical protein